MAGVWSRRLIPFAQNVIYYCARSTQNYGFLHRILLHVQPKLQQHSSRFHHFQRGHGLFWSLFPCDNFNHHRTSLMILSRYDVGGDDYGSSHCFAPMQLTTHIYTHNDVVLRYPRVRGRANDQLFNCYIHTQGEHEAYEVFNYAEADYLAALDFYEEQDGNKTYYDLVETNDDVQSWDQEEEEENEDAIDDEETDDDEYLGSQVEPTSGWNDEYEDEDEEFMAYVADWEDYSDTASDEEEGLSWYVNEDGSWEILSSADAVIVSEEGLSKNLKTRDCKGNSDENEICVVCQECLFQEDDKIAKLECGHEYHLGCIKSWLIKRNICPLCKAKGIEVK